MSFPPLEFESSEILWFEDVTKACFLAWYMKYISTKEVIVRYESEIWDY